MAMFSWLGHRLRLYRLNYIQRRLDDEAERLFEESVQKKDSSIINNWYDENYRTLRWLEYRRTELVSDQLLKEADELYLPRPQNSDKEKWRMWVPEDDDSTMARQLLSAEGMTELRQAIRKERSERRESAEYWLKIVGGFVGILTGLVGALIGLFSVLKHK